MSIRELLLAGAGILALAACGGGDETADSADSADTAAETDTAEVPSPDAMPSEAEAARLEAANAAMQEAQAFLEENKERDGVEVLESGVQVEITEEGEGDSPAAEDVVMMHYTARHADGEVFDSSLERDDPVTESLNVFMPGLRDGVMQLRQGGEGRIVIPPEMAFGATGTPDGTIGPNEALIFEVELIEVIDSENTERLQEIQQESMARAQARFEALSSENAEKADTFLSENADKDGIQVTESGLQYEVLEEGDGDQSPAASDLVEVHYEGTLINGDVFDSSYQRGETIEFPLNGVIAGWTEGLQLMETGDKYRFYIPPNLAYGENGKGPIGPNELLIFDVELIDVKEPPAAPEQPAPAPGEGTPEE